MSNGRKKKKEKDEKKKGKGGVDSNARDTRSDKIISREIYHRNRAVTIHFRADRPLSVPGSKVGGTSFVAQLASRIIVAL